MTRHGWFAALWLALGVVLLVAAYLLINTTFMLYDDEGYVLITYQQFAGGRRLYTDIFSQYGPWPCLYHWFAGTVLQAPLTHTFGRALTALHWVGCSLAAGFLAVRLCRFRPAGFATALVTFGLLWQMCSEPAHPGGLIAVMLALTALGSLMALQTGRWSLLGILLGANGALLLLTKINVGLLFLAGAGGALLHLTAGPVPWQRAARMLGTVGLLAVPWGLMGARLDEPWVLSFAVLTTLALAGHLWLAGRPAHAGAGIPARIWYAAGGGFLLSVVVVVAIMAVRGTTPGELFHAVVVAPLQHPASFMIGLSWPAGVWIVAVAAGGLALQAGRELRTHGRVGRLTSRLTLVFRLGGVAAFLAYANVWPTLTGVSRFLMWSLPLLPVFLIPLHQEDEATGARGAGFFLATCLALPQVLHAYPVAGSQMGWGAFLLLPLFARGLHDTWLALAAEDSRRSLRAPVLGWSLLLLAGILQLGLLVHTGWQRYHQARPVALPGAADLRPGDNARLTMRLMTLNAALHADVLFSYPGMFSYNLWSGAATPTGHNATHWFWLLDDRAQKDVADRLLATPRGAVISNSGFDDYLAQRRVPSRGPLRPVIDANFRPLLTYGHFQFLVPNASTAAPFGQAELLVPAETGGQAAHPALLRTNVVLSGRPVRFELQDVNHPWTVRATYAPPDARVLLEPISSQGRSLGPMLCLPLDRDLQGLYRVHIYAPARPDLSRPYSLVLTGLDAGGATLCESVF